MSENRKCVNCRHNIRKEKPSGNIECVCEITNSHIGYVKCFEGWCRHWANQKSDGKEAKFVVIDDGLEIGTALADLTEYAEKLGVEL